MSKGRRQYEGMVEMQGDQMVTDSIAAVSKLLKSEGALGFKVLVSNVWLVYWWKEHPEAQKARDRLLRALERHWKDSDKSS